MMKLMDGVLIVNKPEDWTSHDVCAFVRNRYRIKKVGHAGTLDPMATGVLVLLLGKATKQSMNLTANDKEYVGVMQLGVKTDTHDRTGKVMAEADWQSMTLELIQERAKVEFTGEIVQVPPMVSAIKYQGVPLYKLARKGVEIARKGRDVNVHEFVISGKEGAYVNFSCVVSKGTYVRTLVHDLGEALGCLATLSNLKRIRSGVFHLDRSVDMDELKKVDMRILEENMLSLGQLNKLMATDPYATLSKD